jgi:hypothetical protein
LAAAICRARSGDVSGARQLGVGGQDAVQRGEVLRARDHELEQLAPLGRHAVAPVLHARRGVGQRTRVFTDARVRRELLAQRVPEDLRGRGRIRLGGERRGRQECEDRGEGPAAEDRVSHSGACGVAGTICGASGEA